MTANVTTMNVTEHRTFLRAAVRRPQIIGAVAPSSRSLAEQLAAVIPNRGAPVVVELGAGTGAVSTVIRERLPSAGRHVAVECDPDMVAYLRQRHSWLEVLHADAAQLDTLLDERQLSTARAVISGLPWSIFTLERQERILRAICRVLEPEGAFTTFGYLHALRMSGARRFRALLEHRFDEVLVTRAIWQNLPPALVYVCRRAKPMPDGVGDT